MGILSNRLISMEPWLHGSTDDETSGHDIPEIELLTDTAATAFLDWRWAMPTTRATEPLPGPTLEQPVFDTLDALAKSHLEDGCFFVEFDGFLIDRQTAAAACALIAA